MTQLKTSVHNIVCIDDNQIDYFVFQKHLKLSGFIGNISYYNNPLEALKRLKKEFTKISPDIFIVDYNMPDMNGLECIERIKLMASTMAPEANIQYVLYSIGNSRLYEALLKKSNIGFIEKPINPSLVHTLLDTISSSKEMNPFSFNSILEGKIPESGLV